MTLDTCMFKVDLQCKNDQDHTDSQNAVRIIEVCRMKSDLHNDGFAIFKIFMYQEYLWKFVGFREMKMLLLTFSVKSMMQMTWALMIEFSSYLTESGVHLVVTYLQILPISR